MKKRGLDLTLLDDVVDDLRQGKALDDKYNDLVFQIHIDPDFRIRFSFAQEAHSLDVISCG